MHCHTVTNSQMGEKLKGKYNSILLLRAWLVASLA